METIGYVYILECANGKFYTGSTIDLAKRMEEHSAGMGANFTRKYLPIQLVYVEIFHRIEDAFKREKQIQGWNHKKKAVLIASQYDSLRKLSECQNDSHSNSIYSHNLEMFIGKLQLK